MAEQFDAYVQDPTWHNPDDLARLAEAERCIDRARRVMGGEGVNDQGEAWDKCLRILDAYEVKL